MAGELGVERFRGEFEKLYNTLKAMHENERKLTKKCRQLNDEIADNVARVSAVLGMTQEELVVNAGIRQVQSAKLVIPRSPQLYRVRRTYANDPSAAYPRGI